MAKKILPPIAFLKTAPHLNSSCEANLKNVCGRHSGNSICHPWLGGSALTSDYKLTLCCAPNPDRMMNVLEEDVETIPGLKHKIDFFKVPIVHSHWGAVWTPSCWAAHWQCGLERVRFLCCCQNQLYGLNMKYRASLCHYQQACFYLGCTFLAVKGPLWEIRKPHIWECSQWNNKTLNVCLLDARVWS